MTGKSLLFRLVITAVLLVIVPASTASDESILEIFGNGNEDDIIDQKDVEYVKSIVLGHNHQTQLADAKYDGKVDILDVTQTELIILGQETELTLIDTADRVVTVEMPVTSTVICFPHVYETLRSLKVPVDSIAGIARNYPEYDPGFFPEIGEIPDVGDRWSPDVEVILTIKPDIVIFTALSAYTDTTQTVNALESAGMKVLCFNLNTLKSYPEEVEKLGYVFDRQEQATEFLTWREDILSSIEERMENISDEDRPRVYFEAASDDGSYNIYGKYAYIAMTGGKDIFSDQPGQYMTVDPEAIADRDPEVIIKVEGTAGGYDLNATDTSGLEKTRMEVMNRDILQHVTAVREENVHVITVHLLSFFGDSGCRNFLQIPYQAKWIHPELFDDLDPEAIHQEYLTRFQGLDIDLNEKGVFVYPTV